MPPRAPRNAGIGLLLFLAYNGLLRSPVTFVMLVLAVAAGESFQIPNTANLAGYEAELMAEGVSRGAGEVRLRPKSGAHFENTEALVARVSEVKGVVAAVPILILPGAIGKNGRWVSAPVVGIDAKAPSKPFRVPTGAALVEGDRESIFVGGSLAGRAGITDGDPIRVQVILDMASTPPQAPSAGAPAQSASGQGVPAQSASAHEAPAQSASVPGAPGKNTDRAPPAATADLAPRKRAMGSYSMRVAGIARGALFADEVAIVDRRFLMEEAGTPGAASLIHIHTGSPDGAAELARELSRMFPDVEARTWEEDSAFLGSAIDGNRALNAISSAMAMIGVAIPVWALLFVSVSQRRREIGLYGALGLGAARVFAIFLMQALVVGTVGVALGALLGYGLVRWFWAHPIFQNDSFAIRPVLSAEELARSVGIILLTTLAAGVYPALRAARVDPARALRGRE